MIRKLGNGDFSYFSELMSVREEWARFYLNWIKKALKRISPCSRTWNRISQQLDLINFICAEFPVSIIFFTRNCARGLTIVNFTLLKSYKDVFLDKVFLFCLEKNLFVSKNILMCLETSLDDSFSLVVFEYLSIAKPLVLFSVRFWESMFYLMFSPDSGQRGHHLDWTILPLTMKPCHFISLS